MVPEIIPHAEFRINLIRAVFGYWFLPLFVFFCSFFPERVAATQIGPDGEFCRTINDPASGQEIILLPGDYRGPCVIRRGGTRERPLIIRGKRDEGRPRVVYEGQSANVLEIHGDHVVVRGLVLGPTRRNVDGVRIFANYGITIEDCEFSRLGGIAIAATRTSVDGLIVRRNVVTNSAATAMYFGCHDGIECLVSNLIVEQNFIHRVDAIDSEVGYGIQFKLNSSGVIRDNVIVDTKGPGIMVYGSTDPSSPNVIERNFVTGSRQSSGVLIGGGPAQVRNNIVSRNFLGGVTLQDYANHGLLRKIAVVNNTAFKNNYGEFVVPSQGKFSQISFTMNAAVSSEGTKVFPRRQTGVDSRQNIDCTTSACFTDPLSLNFSPLPASPVYRVQSLKHASLPLDDYYGRSRKQKPIAGAVAFAAPPIKFGIKSEH